MSATFAQAYAINYVSPLHWVKTDWKRKLARTIIGITVLVGIYAFQTYL